MSDVDPYDTTVYKTPIPPPPPPPTEWRPNPYDPYTKKKRFTFWESTLIGFLATVILIGGGVLIIWYKFNGEQVVTHTNTPTTIATSTSMPTSTLPPTTSPKAPNAIDVAQRMKDLEPQEIYKALYSNSASGDPIVTSPYSPDKGTAMIATMSNGWFTIESFSTTVKAYQDFEANQNMSMILNGTCLLIDTDNQQTPTQPILTAFSQACPA